jgi:hypothetical protein
MTSSSNAWLDPIYEYGYIYIIYIYIELIYIYSYIKVHASSSNSPWIHTTPGDARPVKPGLPSHFPGEMTLRFRHLAATCVPAFVAASVDQWMCSRFLQRFGASAEIDDFYWFLRCVIAECSWFSSKSHTFWTCKVTWPASNLYNRSIPKILGW